MPEAENGLPDGGDGPVAHSEEEIRPGDLRGAHDNAAVGRATWLQGWLLWLMPEGLALLLVQGLTKEGGARPRFCKGI